MLDTSKERWPTLRLNFYGFIVDFDGVWALLGYVFLGLVPMDDSKGATAPRRGRRLSARSTSRQTLTVIRASQCSNGIPGRCS